MDKLDSLVGRFLLSAIFLMAGVSKIFNFAGAEQQMIDRGLQFEIVFQGRINIVPPLLIVAILVEVLASLSIILGYKTRWGAMALIAFMIPTTIVFHVDFTDANQIAHLLKNASILGGLILLAANGPGPVSLDERSEVPGT